MNVHEYNAREIKGQTRRLLGEAAAGALVLIHCASLLELRRLYNAINVQRFRQKQGSAILLRKDKTAWVILLEPKSVDFEWRTPGELQEGDVFYFCDADMRGFAVPDGSPPPHCPYCGADDCFARDGEVPPYLQELRREKRLRRDEHVIAPQESLHD